ncbi:MAG: YdcF family protein [Clostridia bacterium]|nr:YdcF family protein [Clostridia bacterium]
MKKCKLFSLISNNPILKRLLVIALICTIVCATAYVGINVYIISFSSKYVITVEECNNLSVDCVMVLGAGLFDDYPSHMLQERLNVGISVYNTNCTNRLLMTGDHGTVEYDEVNAMKDYAIEAGAVPNEVFMDHAGFSTYESMYRARDVFDVDSVIIVTQKYHLYRAVYNARRLGLNAYGIAADGQFNYSLPMDIYNNFRESLARCKDFVYCIYKPEPTYLGEVIPISSSGVLTDDKKD